MYTIFRYNVKTSPYVNSFDLSIKPYDDHLNICAVYSGWKEKTNLVVIEVEIPSGYKPKEDSLNEMTLKSYQLNSTNVINNVISTKINLVKLVEYIYETNSVAMYFDEMPQNQVCVDIQIEEILPVESRQPSIAKIYDYYDQTDVSILKYLY